MINDVLEKVNLHKKRAKLALLEIKQWEKLNFEFEIVTAKEFLQKEFYNECNNI
jgi:hypothetical protein